MTKFIAITGPQELFEGFSDDVTVRLKCVNFDLGFTHIESAMYYLVDNPRVPIAFEFAQRHPTV